MNEKSVLQSAGLYALCLPIVVYDSIRSTWHDLRVEPKGLIPRKHWALRMHRRANTAKTLCGLAALLLIMAMWVTASLFENDAITFDRAILTSLVEIPLTLLSVWLGDIAQKNARDYACVYHQCCDEIEMRRAAAGRD